MSKAKKYDFMDLISKSHANLVILYPKHVLLARHIIAVVLEASAANREIESEDLQVAGKSMAEIRRQSVQRAVALEKVISLALIDRQVFVKKA